MFLRIQFTIATKIIKLINMFNFYLKEILLRKKTRINRDSILLIKKTQYFKTMNSLTVICNLNIILIYIQPNSFHT